VSEGISATVAGGNDNRAIGLYSAIPGGNSNEAVGNYSFAAGRRAKIYGNGSFIWADSTNEDFNGSGSNRFYVRSSNGIYLYTSSDLSSGSYLSAGGSTWNIISDRTSKRNIRQVDGRNILDKLYQVPICQWSYRSQDPGIEHIGNTLDPDGVALAAIQGLYELVKEKEAENRELKQEINDLNERMAVLEAFMSERSKE